MNPLTFIQTAIACAIAFALGCLIAGLSAYFIGKSHGAESKMKSIGALQTSVESCTVAAGEANAAIKAEALAGKDRERRLTDAITKTNADIRASLAKRRDSALAVAPRGNDECERTTNMINDQFRAKP